MQRHHIDLVVFDLDGTLVDSYPAMSASIRHVTEQLCLPAPSRERIVAAVGWGDRALVGRFVPKAQLDRALRLYRRHHSGSLKKHIRCMPHARTVLRLLRKRGYRLAIVSNRPARFTDIILRRLHMKAYFDMILCKDQVRFGKPHPHMLLRVMRRLRIPPARVLYVGDMSIDVETGKRARVHTYAVTTGSSSVAEIRRKRPDVIAPSLGRFVKMLRRNTPLAL